MVRILLVAGPAVHTPRHVSILDRAMRAATALVDLPAVWGERIRQRRSLGTLPDRLLSDLGLHRDAVDAEVSKPFWRA